MNAKLIGYKNLDETQRKEFENSAKRKRRKNLFWQMLLSPVLMIAAFLIADHFMELPGGRLGALIIAGAITVAFEIWAVITAVKERLQKDFEGEVIEKKTKRVISGGHDHHHVSYRNIMVFRASGGKKIRKSWETGAKLLSYPNWFGYLNVGDRVRFHARMDYYEKYDKSGDSVIPCAKCGAFADITPNNCTECGAPLMKP